MHPILGWLVQNTLVVMLLLPVVLLAGRLWRFRPANQHLLWLLLLIKLLSPPLVNWPLPIDVTRVAWADTPAPTSPALPPAETLMTADALVTEEPLEPAGPTDVSPSNAIPPVATAVTVDVAPASFQLDFAGLLPIALIGIWLTGAAPVSMWIAWQLLLQSRILGRAKPPTRVLEDWINTLGHEFGLSSIRIKVSADVASPFISCLGRPALVWPASLTKVEELSRWEPVLAHELAHLARRDHWVMWLELLALPLLWFHPLMWFVRRRLEETRELACDALALESAEIDRGGFAELLLALSAPSRMPLSPAAPLAAGIGTAFHRRLAMLFCDRARGRISLAGLLVAALLAAAALPGWAQTTDPKPKTPSSAEPPEDITADPVAPAKATSDDKDTGDSVKSVRAGTIGEVKEIKDDVLLVQVLEGKNLPKDVPLFVIRITPTHSEMIGQLRIMKTDGREIAAKLEPQVARPQAGDFVWPAWRTTQPRASAAPAYGRATASTPSALAPVPVPPAAGAPPVALPYPVPTPAPAAYPPANQYRPGRYVTVAMDDGGTMFKLEDGSKIIARLDDNGALRMFLEKDGKRQELSKVKESAPSIRPPSSSPTPMPTTTPHTGPGSSAAPTLQQRPTLVTPYGATTTTSSRSAASQREVALLETNLELAKVEVAEKQILLEQAQDAAKKGLITATEVKLKELELRKAEIKFKQAQLQLEEAKPTTPPAGR